MTDPPPAAFVPLTPPEKLARPLLAWYDRVRRDMPWRQTRDPYAIWLSETMLQQTQVETVKPYYARFLLRFPTVKALAEADLQEVLTQWAGLGYYRRAKHLHQAAQAIVERHGGQLPPSIDELMGLPGVGRYTAGAVGSIAFDLPAPVVDGNVMRVLARLTGYDRDIAEAKHQPFFWSLAGRIVSAAPDRRYGDVNQAMMELGATVCTPPPGRPACLLCPLKDSCRAYAQGRQAELPVKGRKAPVREVRGVALVVLRENATTGRQVLLMRRPMGGIWEGMWEFPVVTGDAKEAAGLAKTLGVRVKTWRACGEVRHGLTHRAMRFDVLAGKVTGRGTGVILPACATADGKPYEAHRWVGWPLEGRADLPMARVVGKIAEAAGEPAKRDGHAA